MKNASTIITGVVIGIGAVMVYDRFIAGEKKSSARGFASLGRASSGRYPCTDAHGNAYMSHVPCPEK